jgi:hypothetical protein
MPYAKISAKKDLFYEAFIALGPSGTLKSLRKVLREQHNEICTLRTLQAYCQSEDWIAKRKLLFAERYRAEHEQFGYNPTSPRDSTCIQGTKCFAINPPYKGWGVRSLDSLCPECSAMSWSVDLP